ncbi:cytochrome p450 [Diaporthe amygdali]|uniref:cytochrome p450 n=1 Tax=Phomopsis amygdali TaxID=1214568 RepID=UPI0022FE25E6|nr:cytochrome p450 [Diaporthe amygdali]KAJ0118801.1 cytochrome p450 [Diaporthe amygdali]
MLEKYGPVLWTALALFIAYTIKTIRKWQYQRFQQYAGIPQPEETSFVWGHMKLMGQLFKNAPDRRLHLDDVIRDYLPHLGNPPVLFLDLRPLNYPMLVVCDHEVAEQITKPSPRWSSSTPKSPTLGDIWHLTGKNSILTSEGDHWKAQRRQLNPGFAPQHLITVLPIVLNKTRFFLDHLDRYSRTGEEFCLDELCVTLTFDIIGAVTMGQDFKAQVPGEQSEILLAFRGIMEQYTSRRGPSIPGTNWMRERIRRRFASKLDRLLKGIVRDEYAQITAGGTKSRSVLALSLQGTEQLTPELLQQTSDNLRVFLFAGHDTTSILLQWAFYELSKSPQQQKALHAELDELFGTDADPDVVREKLLAPGGTEILSQMVYTSAVIKEVLRIHPPAASVRMSQPGTNFQLTLPGGKQVCPDGCILYLCSNVIQRDRKVYGETADDFIPERWLGDTSGLPASAWRPFEKGPRACIGLELANIEAKVILACAARRYDFQKVGLGELELDSRGKPILDEKGYYRTKSELFNSIQVTAKPVDRSMMKVKLSEQAMEN